MIDLICPCCGEEVKCLVEGACALCHYDRQEELDLHNQQYDYWNSLTDKQKEDQIRWSSNYYG